FDTWRVESTANVAAFTKAEAAWNLFNGTPCDSALDVLRASALAAGKEPRRGMWAGIGIGIAASLLAAVALNTGSFSQKEVAVRSTLATVTTPNAPNSGAFVTAKGERRTVRLADGSAITLNTDSAIR